MKIFVKTKPRAKCEDVKEVGPDRFVVAVKEPPEGGRANRAVERATAKHLGVPVSRVRIVSGTNSRQKVIEIS